MKTLLIAAASAALFVLPASAANDYSRIPAPIRAEIKQGCVKQYPRNYVLQAACIRNQSDAYVEVHGAAPAAPRKPTCEEEAKDAAAFMAKEKDYFSAEYAVALEKCIKQTSGKSALGKRLRALDKQMSLRTPME